MFLFMCDSSRIIFHSDLHKGSFYKGTHTFSTVDLKSERMLYESFMSFVLGAILLNGTPQCNTEDVSVKQRISSRDISGEVGNIEKEKNTSLTRLKRFKHLEELVTESGRLIRKPKEIEDFGVTKEYHPRRFRPRHRKRTSP